MTIRRQTGFTMVELLIAMLIFVLTIAAAASIFVPLLTAFKQQSKIAETQMEGIVGLEILRRDLEQAGFGLPWNIPEGVIYQEAANSPADSYNEVVSGSSTNPPRAILSGNNVDYSNIVRGSDYLVVKATNVASSDASVKWTEVKATAGGNRVIRTWGSPGEDLNTSDRVIVLIPSRGGNNQRVLVSNGSNFSVQFNLAVFPQEFSPNIPGDVYLIYGVTPPADPVTDPLRMPFNRADYYISTLNVPRRCAPGTGVLRKAVLNHSGTFQGGIHQLLDCVADMQVIYGLDNDYDGDFEIGTGDSYSDVLSGLSAQGIREQVNEVKICILAHEGQRDVNYKFPGNSISVGGSLGRNFNLTTIPNYQNYRWKIYTLVVKPRNLRG
jgi:prepilin-type N-terminal cleavage/methylation domain-containing protein